MDVTVEDGVVVSSQDHPPAEDVSVSGRSL